MPDSYIIRAAIDAADTSGIFARDLFNCASMTARSTTLRPMLHWPRLTPLTKARTSRA
jgi:hypothetical protein